jgi:biotin synthase-related radical SAM superfamily protein
MVALLDIANALGHKDPKTTAQIYDGHTDKDLVEFAKAVERAVEAGYQQEMAEKVKPGQESTLVS